MSKENDIKRLTEKFFEGDISPEETRMLLEITDEGISDAQTLADLRMIRALHSPELAQLSAPVPADLEERLDRHISSLARRRPTMLRWLTACSAAAAVAVVLSIGIHVNNGSDSTSPATADTSSILPELSLAVPDSRNEMATATTHETPATNNVAKPRLLRAAPRSIATAPRPTTATTTPEANMNVTVPELDLSQTVKVTIDNVQPILASAIVNPADILVQPMSTISQSIDNVYMSFEMVAKALRGTSSTLDDAADKLQIASGLRLHDI